MVAGRAGSPHPLSVAGLGRGLALHPDRVFGIGITLGLALGFVLGSLVTWRFGDSAWDGVHGLLERLTGRDDGINFELLLQ